MSWEIVPMSYEVKLSRHARRRAAEIEANEGSAALEASLKLANGKALTQQAINHADGRVTQSRAMSQGDAQKDACNNMFITGFVVLAGEVVRDYVTHPRRYR